MEFGTGKPLEFEDARTERTKCGGYRDEGNDAMTAFRYVFVRLFLFFFLNKNTSGSLSVLVTRFQTGRTIPLKQKRLTFENSPCFHFRTFGDNSVVYCVKTECNHPLQCAIVNILISFSSEQPSLFFAGQSIRDESRND